MGWHGVRAWMTARNRVEHWHLELGAWSVGIELRCIAWQSGVDPWKWEDQEACARDIAGVYGEVRCLAKVRRREKQAWMDLGI